MKRAEKERTQELVAKIVPRFIICRVYVANRDTEEHHPG